MCQETERPSDVVIWQKSLDVKSSTDKELSQSVCIKLLYFCPHECSVPETLPAVHARFTFMETKAGKIVKKSQLGHTFKDQSVH